MSRRAVILAGGKGSRLRPYTVVLPKPLMPIGEYPILEVIPRQLEEAEHTEKILAEASGGRTHHRYHEDNDRRF